MLEPQALDIKVITRQCRKETADRCRSFKVNDNGVFGNSDTGHEPAASAIVRTVSAQWRDNGLKINRIIVLGLSNNRTQQCD